MFSFGLLAIIAHLLQVKHLGLKMLNKADCKTLLALSALVSLGTATTIMTQCKKSFPRDNQLLFYEDTEVKAICC